MRLPKIQKMAKRWARLVGFGICSSPWFWCANLVTWIAKYILPSGERRGRLVALGIGSSAWFSYTADSRVNVSLRHNEPKGWRLRAELHILIVATLQPLSSARSGRHLVWLERYFHKSKQTTCFNASQPQRSGVRLEDHIQAVNAARLWSWLCHLESCHKSVAQKD